MAAALLLAWAPRELSAQPASGGTPAAQVREGDNTTVTGPGAAAPADDKETARRRAMRRVAASSLLIILILILFIVVVMMSTRRLRIRYLGWNRRIRFNRIWDIWWQKPEEKHPPGKDKPPAK
jgi:hypothetical protein